MIKKILVIFILLSTIIFSQENTMYRDISSEHWAYKSIKKLIENGIIEKDSFFFNGEDSVSRYEVSLYLYKTLEKFNEEKATIDDLMILENLIGEFSEDLLNFGFNIDLYSKKIDEFEKKINSSNIITIENSNNIEELENRLSLLESYLLDENSDDSEKTKVLYRQFGIIENMTLKLENSIFYYNKLEKNQYKNTNNLEFMIYNKFYEVGLLYKSDYEENNLNLKAKLDKDINEYFNFKFNTIGYEKKIDSHFSVLDYDNYNYNKREFYTDGITLTIGNNITYIEKDRENDEKLYIIDKLVINNFEALIISDLNESEIEYDVLFKKDFKKEKYGIKIGYSDIIKENNNLDKVDISIININGTYNYKKWQLSSGLEKKDAKSNLYNNYYSHLSYKFKNYGNFYYKIEYFNLKFNSYTNHHFIIKNESDKIKTYFSFSKYRVIKENYNQNDLSKSDFESVNDKNEFILKVQYNISDAIDINLGYREEKISKQNIRNGLSIVEIGYKFKENRRIFVKYLKNDDVYYDRDKDINHEIIDIDFNSNTGIIDKAKDGRIEFGIELIF
ncbi:MAG: hypothetical protein GX287_00515 [Fusobacteria bacterium]|nr:hypothetical protein [Fusobacteriota bacterium]